MGFMRAKTRSMIPGARRLLFLFSTDMANFWTMTNYVTAGAKDSIITLAITIEFFKRHLLQIIDMIYKTDIQIPDTPH